MILLIPRQNEGNQATMEENRDREAVALKKSQGNQKNRDHEEQSCAVAPKMPTPL